MLVYGTWFRSLSIWFVVLTVSVLAAACGSDVDGTAPVLGPGGELIAEGDAPASEPLVGFQKIRPTSHIYTVDEVVAAGFKKSKEYDVSGLTGATAAIYGFYGTDPYAREEYEIRFYNSHDDAVALGVPMAQEAVGPDAKLTEEDSTLDEGLKERRECQGNIRGSHHVGLCLTAKHQDFAVMGNFVVLCQGSDVADSNKHCDDLFNILPRS